MSLGHWNLHRHDESVFCRSSVIEPETTAQLAGLPPREEEANVFGAALLMPAPLIREQYLRCERDFFRLCETFGASGAAMGRRLRAVIKPEP
jgi:Zn-dependent peptidase ImmA (M78 family)